MANKRVCIPLVKCRANCQEKIDCELQQKIFTNYWSFKSYDRRITFISSLITSSDKITQRKRRNTPEKQKNRVKTYHYSIPKDGINVLVCRGCFLKIFGETDKFIRNICLKKINSPVNTCSPDKRGKAVPRNKYSPEVIKSITDHIDKLPAYESHYCRRETSKKYLPSHFTLQHTYVFMRNTLKL